MNQARMHVGVDVGKECLDICYPDGSKEHIGNTKRSRAKLIRKARAMSAIVSFEATGPYEENLADECLAAGVPAVRLDAWKTRKYAESQGMLEKTDAIDCEMIRDFAASLKPEQLRFVRPMSDGYRRLKRATSVRRNLIKAKTLVVNQLENILDKDVRASVSRVIDALERQIEKMDALCTEAIRSDDKMNALAVRFEQVVGVGPVLISTMLSSCPDIGSFTSKGIAKMAGVAGVVKLAENRHNRSPESRRIGETALVEVESAFNRAFADADLFEKFRFGKLRKLVRPQCNQVVDCICRRKNLLVSRLSPELALDLQHALGYRLQHDAGRGGIRRMCIRLL